MHFSIGTKTKRLKYMDTGSLIIDRPGKLRALKMQTRQNVDIKFKYLNASSGLKINIHFAYTNASIYTGIYEIF